MVYPRLIAIGFLGSIFMMFRFAKYCRLLNNRWKLDPKTVERYQAGAQRSLAAMIVLLGGCGLTILVGFIASAIR